MHGPKQLSDPQLHQTDCCFDHRGFWLLVTRAYKARQRAFVWNVTQEIPYGAAALDNFLDSFEKTMENPGGAKIDCVKHMTILMRSYGE